jgi:aminoglycoside phosphotransferase
MEPKSSSPLRLPPAVRAAALAAVGGGRLQKEFAWMSWAGTVWRLEGASAAVYVKRAHNLEGERDRTVWLAGRLPVPEVLGLFKGFGDDWLLTRAIPGLPLSDRALGWEPPLVARRLGEILRDIHDVDATGCPFGERAAGHVLIHGDYCLPNVLVENGRLSGLIDVGGAGLGDPQDDLAAGVWTLQYNFGPGNARDFLDAYGWPPMSDKAIERLRRRYGR